jgi:hypothetical protein
LFARDQNILQSSALAEFCISHTATGDLTHSALFYLLTSN